MKEKNKKTILKILILLISIAIFVLVIWTLWPVMKELSTKEGQLAFKDKINSMGLKGPLLLYLLEAAQMLLVVLPGEPVEVLYGMCYGTIYGAVLLTFAVFINTIIVYFLVKKFGRKILVFYFSEEKIKKVESSKWFNNTKKMESILIILFFLPGTPKDLLLYLGAFLPINPVKFVLISTFVRFPSVITSTIAGDNITNGKMYISVFVYIITAILIIIFNYFLKKYGKNSGVKDIIDSIK